VVVWLVVVVELAHSEHGVLKGVVELFGVAKQIELVVLRMKVE
jgi:hypothetical protein